jgi:hypothetical protein
MWFSRAIEFSLVHLRSIGGGAQVQRRDESPQQVMSRASVAT